MMGCAKRGAAATTAKRTTDERSTTLRPSSEGRERETREGIEGVRTVSQYVGAMDDVLTSEALEVVSTTDST